MEAYTVSSGGSMTRMRGMGARAGAGTRAKAGAGARAATVDFSVAVEGDSTPVLGADASF